MNLSETLSYIESSEFIWKLQLASSESMFISILERDDHYRKLRSQLQKDVGAVGTVLSRIKRLASLSYDARYENPYDVPMAVLSLAVAFVPSYGELAAELLRSAHNVWWSSKLRSFLSRASTRLPNATVEQEIAFVTSDIRLKTWALTREANLDLMTGLDQINVTPISTVHSSSAANAPFSQIMPNDSSAVWATSTGAKVSNFQVGFAVAA